QTQVGIAREAVSPKADVEAVRTQPFERKGRVTKETVTARAMRDVKSWRVSQQIEVCRIQFVQMRDNPAVVHGSSSQETRDRCFVAAIFHRTADAFQKIECRSARVAKHLCLVARFSEMRRQKNVLFSRDFFAL